MIIASIRISPWSCPLGYPKERTDCSGCDEFVGILYVNSGEGLVPTVSCAVEPLKNGEGFAMGGESYYEPEVRDGRLDRK